MHFIVRLFKIRNQGKISKAAREKVQMNKDINDSWLLIKKHKPEDSGCMSLKYWRGENMSTVVVLVWGKETYSYPE